MNMNCTAQPAAATKFSRRATVLVVNELGSELGRPGTAGFEDGIEGDEELSHAGDEDDFEGFTMLSEPIGEGFDDGVISLGGEGRHVENTADGFAAAADSPFA